MSENSSNSKAFSTSAFFAFQFPFAANAISIYGVRQHYGRIETNALDWTAILERLHADGFVVPGPMIGRTSFWMLTSMYRNGLGYIRLWMTLEKMLGAAWGAAVIELIERDVIRGPALRRPWNTFYKIPHDGQISYAFRFRDEPAPWFRKHRTRLTRSVVGRVPDRWQTIPWYVPNLQEHPSRPDHHAPMGDESPRELQDIEAIEDIEAKSLDSMSSNALSSDMAVLLKIAERFDQRSDIAKRALRLFLKVKAAYNAALDDVVEETISTLTEMSPREEYELIRGIIDKIDVPQLRTILIAELESAKTRLQGKKI